MDLFHISKLRANGKKQTKEINRNSLDQDDELNPRILVQLPLYFTALSNDIRSNEEEINIEGIESSLRLIKKSLEEIGSFPFETFFNFDIHSILFFIIENGISSYSVGLSLEIIGYYYCYHPEGVKLIRSSPILPFFMTSFYKPEMKIFLSPILSGIAGILRESGIKEPEESTKQLREQFLSDNLHLQIIELLNENGDDNSPIFEVAIIIKSLIKGEISLDFLPALLSLLPTLIFFLNSEDYKVIRKSIQSLRHLSIQFPQSNESITNSGYIENLFQILYRPHQAKGIFKSALYLLAVYCHGRIEVCQEILNPDFQNLIFTFFQNEKSDTKFIENALRDIRHIIDTDPSLLVNLSNSQLIDYIIENSKIGENNVCIQCCIILSKIFTSSLVEIIDRVLELDGLECLQYLLISEISFSNVIFGLDSIINIFEIGMKENAGWVQKLADQDWLSESIEDIIDNDTFPPEIREKAQFVNDRILSQLYS